MELSTSQPERSGSWQGQLQTSAEDAFVYTVLKHLAYYRCFRTYALQIDLLTYLLGERLRVRRGLALLRKSPNGVPVAPERISKWGTGPERKWGRAPKRWKKFWSYPSTFLALKVQLVVLVSAFVMVSTVWSVSCLLFFYSRCTPVPHGVGATVLYSTWDAGVGGVQVRDGLAASVHRIHVVVGQPDDAAASSRASSVDDREDVDAAFAASVHVADAATDALATVERVVGHDQRVGVARSVEFFDVAILADLCARTRSFRHYFVNFAPFDGVLNTVSTISAIGKWLQVLVLWLLYTDGSWVMYSRSWVNYLMGYGSQI